MDVIDLRPIPDDMLDTLAQSATCDYEAHEITSIRPRTLLRVLAEVKAARLAALTDADRTALMTVRDLVVLAQATCVGRPGAVRGHEAATRGVAVLDRLLGIGGGS